MDSAEKPQPSTDQGPDVTALVTERYGLDDPNDKIVHDLRLLADFYQAHPDHPRPVYLQIGHEAVPDRAELNRLIPTFCCLEPYGPELDQTHHQLEGETLRMVLILRVAQPDRPL